MQLPKMLNSANAEIKSHFVVLYLGMLTLGPLLKLSKSLASRYTHKRALMPRTMHLIIWRGFNIRNSLFRVTRRIEKNSPNFSKNGPKVAKSKKAKISTTKLNLKTKNIYIKPVLKP
jgi:hypothetical protein